MTHIIVLPGVLFVRLFTGVQAMAALIWAATAGGLEQEDAEGRLQQERSPGPRGVVRPTTEGPVGVPGTRYPVLSNDGPPDTFATTLEHDRRSIAGEQT